MPPASPGATLGLILAAAILAAAAFLAHRLRSDRRRRGAGLAAADARHFARQDVRRWVGTAVMALLAVGLAIAIRLGPPREKAAALTRAWARAWVGVCVLVVVLLILALFDWAATNAYARRHRRALARQHRAALEAELRRRAAPRNGHSGPDGPLDAPPAG